MMIHVGVDLHQRFCYMTALETRGKLLQSGAVNNERLALKRYFRQFRGQAVEVAVEACGFWPAFREVVEPEVRRLVLVHPQRVKAIASAKLKNDRVDSATLAHLLRCDLLPEPWQADRATQARRQQVRLRATLVRHRTRLKNQVHAVLHQQGLHSPVTDLFGKRGRQWLAGLKLPATARESVNVCLRLLDGYNEEVQRQNLQLSEKAKQDERAQWLMTIPGRDLKPRHFKARIETERAARLSDPSANSSCLCFTAWTRFRSPRLPTEAPECTSNSCCAVPIHGGESNASTDRARVCTPLQPVQIR